MKRITKQKRKENRKTEGKNGGEIRKRRDIRIERVRERERERESIKKVKRKGKR